MAVVRGGLKNSCWCWSQEGVLWVVLVVQQLPFIYKRFLSEYSLFKKQGRIFKNEILLHKKTVQSQEIHFRIWIMANGVENYSRTHLNLYIDCEALGGIKNGVVEIYQILDKMFSDFDPCNQKVQYVWELARPKLSCNYFKIPCVTKEGEKHSIVWSKGDETNKIEIARNYVIVQ